jgi:hypothetical protein
VYPKWLKNNYDKSKLHLKEDLHHWRTYDFDALFEKNDAGGKGYLNSKEQRRMLTEAGVTMMTTFNVVKVDKYLGKRDLADKIEEMLPQEVVARRAKNVFLYCDRKESPDGRLTGFVSRQTVEENLREHGLDDMEIYIFLSAYRRNDDKVEYARILEVLFPEDLCTHNDFGSTSTGSAKKERKSTAGSMIDDGQVVMVG